MICNQCRELISDYIDGTLELGEQVKVERHLADCEPCRAVRDDLLQIVHFSQHLPEQSPSPTLWRNIQAEIAAQRPAGFWSRIAFWMASVQQRHLNLSVYQMAAVAAAFVIVVSISAVLSRRDSANLSVPVTQPQVAPSAIEKNLLSYSDIEPIEQRINQLRERVEQRKVSWNPELQAAFDRNMYYVDQSLLECRQQLSDNPTDQVSKELMLNAYREKVRVLEGFEKF